MNAEKKVLTIFKKQLYIAIHPSIKGVSTTVIYGLLYIAFKSRN